LLWFCLGWAILLFIFLCGTCGAPQELL
jgi:hypothetical protein